MNQENSLDLNQRMAIIFSDCQLQLADHHVSFKYQPDCYFEYVVDGKTMKYFPDFKVKDEYIEIKGLQFFKDKDPTKQMVCPYDHSKDNIYEAKHQCMIKNNVKIMTESDYQIYLDYIKSQYGKKYLDQFRKSDESG